MNYKIRKKQREDCLGIAHVVTVAWNETYKGIVLDEFLNKYIEVSHLQEKYINILREHISRRES